MPVEPIEGLILSSTTDTQDQVNEAAGIKIVEVEAPEVEETETAAATETAEETESEKPKGKKIGGFQKRINALTKTLREEQSKREELEQRLAAKPAAAAATEETPKPDERPKLADFNGDADKWFDARVEWDKKQAAKLAEEEERREVFDTYQTRKAEAAKQHEDWNDVMAEVEAGKVTIPIAASNAIIESEQGPEIAYYLAKNPDVRERLAEMSITSAVREIGRIEALVTPKISDSPKPIRTNAPKPITPVGGSTKRTASLEDASSDEEYYEIRKSQLAQRRGR